MLAKNRNQFFVIVIVLFFSSCSKVEIQKQPASRPEGIKFYGDNSGNVLCSFGNTNDGGYFFGGYSNTSNGNGSQAFIQKTDVKGNIEWYHTYGGKFLDSFTTVHQCSDGGFIAAGSTSSYGNAILRNDGYSDGYVVKTDAMGNVQWQKTFGDIYYDALFDAKETPDHGFVVAGGFNILNTQDNQYERRVVVIKMDKDGNKLWERILFLSDYKSEATSLDVAPNGQIGIAVSMVISDFVKDQRSYYPAFACLNENGLALVLKQVYPDWGIMGIYGKVFIHAVSDGFVMAANMSDNTNSFMLFKTDFNGSIVWNHRFSGLGSATTYSIETDLSDNIMICGNTIDANGTHYDMYIKTNNEGNKTSEIEFPVNNFNTWLSGITEENGILSWGIGMVPYSTKQSGNFGILFTDTKGKIIE